MRAEDISICKQAPSLTLQLHTAWARNCAAKIGAAVERSLFETLLIPQTRTDFVMGGGQGKESCQMGFSESVKTGQRAESHVYALLCSFSSAGEQNHFKAPFYALSDK